jgi:hypothetical protein
MDLLIILIGLISLALAAQRWGTSSIDGLESAEWRWRRQWRGHARLD